MTGPAFFQCRNTTCFIIFIHAWFLYTKVNSSRQRLYFIFQPVAQSLYTTDAQEIPFPSLISTSVSGNYKDYGCGQRIYYFFNSMILGNLLKFIQLLLPHLCLLHELVRVLSKLPCTFSVCSLYLITCSSLFMIASTSVCKELIAGMILCAN